MIHPAWQNFASKIQECTLENLTQNKEFMTTMYCSTYIKQELEYLMKICSKQELSYLVKEPIESLGEGNNIHQLYHLMQFINFAGIDTLRDGVAEFGAGYGSLCVRINRLAFTNRYNIIELPELQGIQKRYLKENNVKNVEWYDSFKEYLKSGSKNKTFIALWSLSETTREVRDFILQEADFDNYFFAYGNSFYDMQNLNYFNQFRELRPYLQWKKIKIDFMNDQYYLIGKKE